MSENPYEAPRVFDAPVSSPTDAESIRKAHINTEASLRSVGFLYYLAGVGFLVTGLHQLTGMEDATGGGYISRQTALALGLAAGGVLFFLGAAVRKLKPWSRFGIAVLSGISLLNLPIGTLIGAYILFLTFGKKGRMVFSEEYKQVIAATPHVKCRTSRTAWIVLGIFVAMLAILALSLTRFG